MEKSWKILAYSQGALSVAVGSSLILRPPPRPASDVLTRLDQFAGGLNVVGVFCMVVGASSLLAMLASRGVRLVFGTAAAVFALLSVALLAPAVYAGTGWAGAAMGLHFTATNLVVVRAAAKSRARAGVVDTPRDAE